MTIFGWDLSHYDAVPSGARVVSEGFSFMTHKAGGDAIDTELAAWWSAVKAQRGELLLGAYWVLYPGGAANRANSFISRLDTQCPGWRDGPFILQADCEKWNGDASTVPSLTDIETFCDRLSVLVPKLRPIVYAPQWVYGGSLKGLSYPLWASSYVTGSGPASKLYPGDMSPRWGAYSGQTPAILQFASSATIAGQTTSDANAYRGTLAELTALVAPGWKTEEPDMNLTDRIGSKAYPTRTVQDFINDVEGFRDVLRGDVPGTKAAAYPADSPLMRLLGVANAVSAVSQKIDALEEKINAQVAIPQEQLDLAVLNALKTLAGGQA